MELRNGLKLIVTSETVTYGVRGYNRANEVKPPKNHPLRWPLTHDKAFGGTLVPCNIGSFGMHLWDNWWLGCEQPTAQPATGSYPVFASISFMAGLVAR